MRLNRSFGFLGLSIGYLIIRGLLFLIPLMLNGWEPFIFLDSQEYGALSLLSFSNPSFYLQRPFVFLFFLKITHQNHMILILFQWIISVISWLFLAFIVKGNVAHQRTAYGVFIAILLFSCNGYVVYWDDMVLTESLNLSLVAVFMALYVKAFQPHVNPLLMVGMITVTFLLVNLRDANDCFIFFMGVFIVLLSFFKSFYLSKKRVLLFFLMTLAFLCVSVGTLQKGARWLIPFENMMAVRLLGDNKMVTAFDKEHMPDSLKHYRAGASFWEKIDRYRRLSVAEYDWIMQKGQLVYRRYLLSHPAYVLSCYGQPLFWTSLLGSFDSLFEYSPFLPKFYHNRTIAVYFLFFIAIMSLVMDFLVFTFFIGAIVLCYQRAIYKNRTFVIFAFVFAISITVNALLIWHADGIEFARHQLPNHMLLFLSMVIMTALLFDVQKNITVGKSE